MVNSYPALAFNSGVAYMIDGDTYPTPTNIRILQSASIDLKASTKDLFGQNLLPVAVGRSQIKVSGKIKFADYQGRVIRDFIGGPNNTLKAAGQTLIANAELGSVSGATRTVTNSATFVADYGVVYAATGIPLTAVSAAPAVGQYAVSAGVYTFNASDNGANNTLYSYAYTASGGETVTLSNQSAGAANTFQLALGSSYNGIQTNFLLYSCIPVGLKALDNKLGDFSMMEMDFDATVNAAGNLGIVSLPVTS